MRVIVIAVVLASVVLLLSDMCDAKKTHSNRQRRSDVENPTMSNEKSKNNDVKYHDKRKQKKQSDDDIDTEVPDSNEKNHKNRKVRHQKKNKDENLVWDKQEDVKSQHKRKCDNTKCGRNRVRDVTIHDSHNIHNDDDGSTSSSESESAPSRIKNQKKQKKIKKNYKSETAEEYDDEYHNKKQKKHNKTMDKNKSKHGDKNIKQSDQETPDDSDTELNMEETEEKYSTRNKVDKTSHSIKTKRSKSNDSEQRGENVAVPEKMPSKKGPAESSTHVDPANGDIDENLQNADPETCLNDATDDEHPLDKSCEI